MIERVLNDFDIDQIANSGQCFRFHRVGDPSAAHNVTAANFFTLIIVPSLLMF